jgi:NTE family protein
MAPPVIVLSGGAARGAGHLGFLKAMSDAGIVPKAIVGTSAGALMGALYSSWNCSTEKARERLFSLTYRSILRFGFSTRGIFSSLHMERTIRNSLGKMSFEDLPVPLVAVATNLETRSLELLDSGDLASAVAASCALPPFFPPVVRQGRSYLVGGILSIVPVLAARERYPGAPLVAVDVNVPSPDTPPFSARQRIPVENLVTLSVRSIGLSIARAACLERSFADHAVLVTGGDYPLLGLRSIETIYELGYTAGKNFFGR